MSSIAPCVVTQLHVPSIYPQGGNKWDWQNGVLKFYIDGESEASINITLLELSFVGAEASKGSAPSLDNRGLPWSIASFGHTAKSGGVSSTLRIPFSISLRVTIQVLCTIISYVLSHIHP